MKSLQLLALAVLLSGSLAPGAETGKHLFILSGQSNMVRLNPEVSLKPAWAKEFGTSGFIIAKYAVNAAGIRNWYDVKPKRRKPGPDAAPLPLTGKFYDEMMVQVNNAMQGQSIRSVTLLWMQGEADGEQRMGEATYLENLKGLVAQVEKDLGRTGMFVVVGRISDYTPLKFEGKWADWETEGKGFWDQIRSAQMKFAESNPRYAWVNTDDLNDGVKNPKGVVHDNDLHYPSNGSKILGERFAAKTISLIKKGAK